MNSDTAIKSEGMNILVKNLGMIAAERFVMLIHKDTFDYTEWQESLFADKSISEIHEAAAEYWEKNQIEQRV